MKSRKTSALVLGLLSVSMIAQSANAATIVLYDTCFNGTAKTVTEHSSKEVHPVIFLSGFPKRISELKKLPPVRNEEERDEQAREWLENRIAQDRCESIDEETDNRRVTCNGQILDATYADDAEGERVINAKRFRCVKTIRCEVTDEEKARYVESMTNEEVDADLPAQCLSETAQTEQL